MKIGVIGSGSWATALVKILQENLDSLAWYVRETEAREYIKQYGRNQSYLTSVNIDLKKVRITESIDELVEQCEHVVVVVPSAYAPIWLEDLTAPIAERFVITAVKGIIPKDHITVSEYLKRKFGVSYQRMGVISGPCHAEEVALSRLSYLTFSCKHPEDSERIASFFQSSYIHTITGNDIYGCEYSAILKNIYAVACGVAHGLGYGDNFLAVLTCNAQAEMRTFLEGSYPSPRHIDASAYLGDLLVTCYSQFSRNRTFGTMIGKGYSVKSAQLEMSMVAEGYYATEGIWAINQHHGIAMPIMEAMYNILYRHASPKREMALLAEKLV